MTEPTKDQTWARILNEVHTEFDVRKCVIVTGSFRAGTSLVCSMLGANGLAGIRAERFAPFWQYRKEADPDAIRAALRGVFQSTLQGVFVTKIMWPHRNSLATCMGYDRDNSAAFAKIFPDAKWINVTRRDKIGQAVSFWRAKTTNAWDSGSVARGDAKDMPPPDFDFKEIRACFVELSAHDLLWQDFHETAGTDVMDVAYEDFTAHTRPHLLQLQQFLAGHGVRKDAMVQETPYAKQRDGLSRDYKAQFLDMMYRTGF